MKWSSLDICRKFLTSKVRYSEKVKTFRELSRHNHLLNSHLLEYSFAICEYRSVFRNSIFWKLKFDPLGRGWLSLLPVANQNRTFRDFYDNMGLNTALVTTDEAPVFGADNFALELDQDCLQDKTKNAFNDPLLRSSLPSHAENTKTSSSSPSSTSDCHSISSRTGSSVGSDKLTADDSHSNRSVESSSGVSSSKISDGSVRKDSSSTSVTSSTPDGLVGKDCRSDSESSGVSSTSTPDGSVRRDSRSTSVSSGVDVTLTTGEPVAKQSDIDASVDSPKSTTKSTSASKSDVLAMISLSQPNTKQKGLRHSIARGWNTAKRVQTAPRDFR